MTPSDAQKRLRQITCLTPSNFAELLEISREIIDCWLAADFEYPSAYLDEFISIDSQADSLRMSGDEGEKHRFYDTFRKPFAEELKNMEKLLAGKGPSKQP